MKELSALREAEAERDAAMAFVRDIAELDNWIGKGVGSTSQEQWQMDTERAIADRARAFLATLPTRPERNE